MNKPENNQVNFHKSLLTCRSYYEPFLTYDNGTYVTLWLTMYGVVNHVWVNDPLGHKLNLIIAQCYSLTLSWHRLNSLTICIYE